MRETHLQVHGSQSVKNVAMTNSEIPVLTVLTSSHGVIVKRFREVDGAVEITPAAQIYRGHAETVVVDGPVSLLKNIEGLMPNQALSLGRLPEIGPRYPLASQLLRQEGEISRSKEFLYWNNGPGWMLLDVDTKGLPDPILNVVGGRCLSEVIGDVVPEIKTAPRLIKPSSSAGIITSKGEARKASGLHIYVSVASCSEVPTLLRLIHNRLWAAGLGFFTTSKSGQVLERSLVDTSVGSPERLVFAAAPIVYLPLMRDPPPSQIFGEGSRLTHVIPPDWELVEKLKADARRVIKPEAKKQKKRYETEQIDRVMNKLRVPKGEARRIVKQRLEMQMLNDDDLLETGRGRFERVGDFLNRVSGPTALPCPIEGSDYGMSTAYYYPASERCPLPQIISFAHGNITKFNFSRFRKLKGLTWLDR